MQVLTVLILMLLVAASMSAVFALLAWKLRLAFSAAAVAVLIVVLVGVTLGALNCFGLLEGWELTVKNANTLEVLGETSCSQLIVAGWQRRSSWESGDCGPFVITCRGVPALLLRRTSGW